jgi:hypothetical protein
MALLARQLASVYADLAAPSAQCDQTVADCASSPQSLAKAQAELATLQPGQRGMHSAKTLLALHDV